MVSVSEDPRWWKPSWNLNQEIMKVWAFSDFLSKVKSDFENFKWLFQIEDDGGIGGKCTCVPLIVINEKLSNWNLNEEIMKVWAFSDF